MLTPQARVYLAVNDPLGLEALIGGDGRFTVLGGDHDGDAARKSVSALGPDCVVLDMNLRGADGLEMLGEWRETLASPPRVLLRCPYGEIAWREKALNAGADRVMGPGEEGALISLLWETAQGPLPALASPWAEKRRQIAEGLIQRLGVSAELKGRAYSVEAVAALCCAPQLAEPLAERLYPYLAEKFRTTAGAAERAIRTAVESTWLTGSLEAIHDLFGLSVDADKGKPTNREFLIMLSEHARREMKRYLWTRSGA